MILTTQKYAIIRAMCNQEQLQNISLTSLNGYLSRRIEAYLHTLLRPYGLGVEQMIALWILSKMVKDCVNISKLSELLLKDRTTTSRLIASLESKGFVKKNTDDKKDKRIVYVGITKKGEEKVKEIESSKIRTQAEEVLWGGLSENEREAFKTTLFKVIGALDGRD